MAQAGLADRAHANPFKKATMPPDNLEKPPTPEDDAQAASLSAGIDDPALREAVRRAAAASLSAARVGRGV